MRLFGAPDAKFVKILALKHVIGTRLYVPERQNKRNNPFNNAKNNSKFNPTLY